MTDTNTQLAQNSPLTQQQPVPTQRTTVQNHQYFREAADDIKSIFSADPVTVGVRRSRGYVTTPYTQWTSNDLVQIHDNPRTSVLFRDLHNMFRSAQGGRGDPVAIEELRGLAPTRCNRDFQCFRSIFNEAIDRINARHGSIDLPPEVRDRALAALGNSDITLTDSNPQDLQLSFTTERNLAANLSTVRVA